MESGGISKEKRHSPAWQALEEERRKMDEALASLAVVQEQKHLGAATETRDSYNDEPEIIRVMRVQDGALIVHEIVLDDEAGNVCLAP